MPCASVGLLFCILLAVERT
uniref:Uncharacterized protein n=1 Tax=Rhizophora mucronata TaxID=61149 RepID=A0A2P2Q1E9_RHIMU